MADRLKDLEQQGGTKSKINPQKLAKLETVVTENQKGTSAQIQYSHCTIVGTSMWACAMTIIIIVMIPTEI